MVRQRRISKLMVKIISIFMSIACLTIVCYPALAEVGISEGIQDRLGIPRDLDDTVVNIIKWALGILGLIALIIVIYGGFVWLTAAGNEDKVATAKKIISAAIIGIVIILLSWAIISFVAQGIILSSGDSGA